MAESKIEWTDKVWNPVAGCTWASPGCDNCYAATMTRRLEAMGQADYAGLTTKKHFNGKIKLRPPRLTEPLRWRKPRRVFVNSMSDLFHEGVPFEFVDQVFAVMALAPQHTFQVLTKRPERMAEYLCSDRFRPFRVIRASVAVQTPETRFVNTCGTDNWWPLPNVWLGTSVEDQTRADERIPHLLECPAAVRFLSLEPLLGPVTIHDEALRRLGWCIVGGESGHGSRPCHPDWVRSIRDQCVAAEVPFFFKQVGEWELRPVDPQAENAHVNCLTIDGLNQSWSHRSDNGWWRLDSDQWRNVADPPPANTLVLRRVGKKAAGRLLDGQEWSQYPEVIR